MIGMLRLCLALWPLWSTVAFAPSQLPRLLQHSAASTTWKRSGPGSNLRPLSRRFYQENATEASLGDMSPLNRFERTASAERQVDEPCILTIEGVRYNVTAWAKAHPGGVKVLEKFHNRDATRAFHAAHHSAAAIAMLQDFVIPADDDRSETTGTAVTTEERLAEKDNKDSLKTVPRWRRKLFTPEDPIGVHKCLGVFCLLHFVVRFVQMYIGDPSAGLGSRPGLLGRRWVPLACLGAHGLLSLSSLIFHHVPKDRVVGMPMIWQEYRVHNIVFGIRSVVTAALCSVAIQYGNNAGRWRQVAVWGSGMAVLLSNVGADLGTRYLRSNQLESTTATMPYWEGCSVETQKKFKSFYAYSQFMATLACLAVMNPAWPLAVLLAIQMASLFMTLVRKGLLSAKGYHIGYTATLVAPYYVGLRSLWITGRPDFIGMVLLAGLLYQARRRGVNKYAMWIPIVAARIAWGDKLLAWEGIW